MDIKLYSLDRNRLISFLGKYNVDLDADIMSLPQEESTEILVGMAASLVSSTSSRDTMLQSELIAVFPSSSDIIGYLLESVGYFMTKDIADQLLELDSNKRAITIVIDGDTGKILDGFPLRISAGTCVIFCGPCKDTGGQPISCVEVAGELAISCIRYVPFGFHKWEVTLNSSLQSSGHFMATSPVFEYVRAVDAIFDHIYYGWSYGGSWTEDIENALLELLVGVNEELETTVRSWRPMMSMLGGGALAETTKIVDTIRGDIQSILCSQNGYSMGRLHQAIVQLQDGSGNMLRLPDAFTSATNSFLTAKMRNTPRPALIDKLCTMVDASIALMVAADVNYGLVSHSHRARIQTFLSILNIEYHGSTIFHNGNQVLYENTLAQSNHFDMDVNTIVSAISKLQPNPMEMMSSMPPNPLSSGPLSVSYLPSIPLNALSDGPLLDKYADIYAECLLMDVFNIGSLLGTSLESVSVEEGSSYICKLLGAGFAYVVGTGGKLMGLMNMDRSMIFLRSKSNSWDLNENENLSSTNACTHDNSGMSPLFVPAPLPPSLQKRLRDMPRIFRNKINPGSKLSLKLTSNFDLAVDKLRRHHGDDCWVDASLELVWRHMAYQVPPKLLIFELWYDDELIAADFGHPMTDTGTSVYIATRFFNREDAKIKHLMPGFMLALVECNVLRKLGCNIWDLGGVDMCPLMQYKYDLAGNPLQRPQALHFFREARNNKNLRHNQPGLRIETTSTTTATAATIDGVSCERGGSCEGVFSATGVSCCNYIHSLNDVVAGMTLVSSISMEELS